MYARLLLLVGCVISSAAFATGSVDCQGKLGQDTVTLNWGTSHMEGAPMISPFAITMGKAKTMKICDTSKRHHLCDKDEVKGVTVGYWVSGERIMISVLDENAQQNILRLESWFDKKKKSYSGRLTLRPPLVEKETSLGMVCDQS